MMCRRLGMLIPALVMVVSVSAAATDEPLASTHGAVLTLTRQLFDALGTGRSNVWDKALTDTAEVADQGGRRQTKADVVKDIRKPPRGSSRAIEIRDPKVRQDGDMVVLECENVEWDTVAGQKTELRYRSTLTFVKRGREWKLASLSTATVPSAPLPAAWNLIKGTTSGASGQASVK